MSPKISVIMSVYNGACYLKKSVESVLNQTLSNFEFIIIDDGSTDTTWEILSEYAQQDQRIRLFKNADNIGLTKSLNRGIAQSREAYIARQDADDISLPQRFERQIKVLYEHPEVVLVSSDVECIDSKGQVVGGFQRAESPDIVAWHLLFYNHVGAHSQVMFRREPAISSGGYSEHQLYAQDYEFWLRLVQIGNFMILPEVLIQYRIGCRDSISVKAKAEQDHYALLNASYHLTQLIGEDVSVANVKEFEGFWGRDAFPNVHRAGSLHTKLKKIYRAFLKQRVQQELCIAEIETSCRLKALIYERFLLWSQTIRFRHRPFVKLTLLFYAAIWNPRRIL